MLASAALTAVRASVRRDGADVQYLDSDALIRLELEYRRLRRMLAVRVPSLYEAEAPATITAGNTTFAKPSLFERLVRLERLASGTSYYPVTVLGEDALHANQPRTLTAYERAATFVVRPDAQAPGTYRITYVQAPAASFVVGTAIDVPEGLELVLIERVAAWVQRRHDDEAKEHRDEAEAVLKEQLPLLTKRYGRHPVPGLAITR